MTPDGQRVDLRNIRSPILVFASFGDNITPPQQALGWILDLYDSVDDIRSREQTIIYNLHHDIGHLGIFVSGKIARRETAEFVENIDFIDLLPPGLYELIIEPKDPNVPGAELVAGNFITRFEPRTLDDIRAYGANDPEDELRFATVKRISETNLGLYDLLMAPWVRMMTTEGTAELLRRMNPARAQYYLFSDLNPFMRMAQSAAEVVRENRRPASEDNPFLTLQNQVSDQIVRALDNFRDTRDAASEAFFLNLYGSPLLQALVGLGAPGARTRLPRARDEAHEALVARRIADIKARVNQGGELEALLRILIHVRERRRRGRRARLPGDPEAPPGTPGRQVAAFEPAQGDHQGTSLPDAARRGPGPGGSADTAADRAGTPHRTRHRPTHSGGAWPLASGRTRTSAPDGGAAWP